MAHETRARRASRDDVDARAGSQATSESTPRHAAIPVRDVHLEAAFTTVPKYFAGGDVALSHLFAMLSATFPDGENYFVRSVSAVRDRISDVERYTDWGYRTLERISSPRLHLAVTAAFEHYTATLAELLPGDPEASAVFEHDAVRRLFIWHALEETEHKAVAFDTFRHFGGGEFRRRLAMTAATVDFISHVVGITLVSIALDPDARRHPLRTMRSLVGLFRSPFASLGAVKQLARYYRRGFPPNDRDTSELVTRWRRELFD